MQKLLISLFLIRIFTPCVCLNKEAFEKLEKVPEYSEYLKQLGYLKQNYTEKSRRIDAPSPPIISLPAIELCKTGPPDNSFYGHVFCWGMIGLYIMLIGSLIIYQLRSIFWLKTNIPKNNNVQQYNLKDFNKKSKNEQNFSRLLSV
jgi:hypothetical protein